MIKTTAIMLQELNNYKNPRDKLAHMVTGIIRNESYDSRIPVGKHYLLSIVFVF